MFWVLRALFLVAFLTVFVPLVFWGAALTRETRSAQDLMPSQGRLVETDLGQIYIEEKGPADGKPILLLHGAMAWSGLWRETSAALAENGYRAIAFDMPPFGFSDRDPNADYSVEQQARRISALNTALGIEPILVAHSSGACAGIMAAAQSPETLKGLVLVNAAIGDGLGERLPMAELPTQPWWLRTLAISILENNPNRIRSNFENLLYRKERAAQYVDILEHPMTRRGTTAAISDWYAFYGNFLSTPHCIDRSLLYGLKLPYGVVWGLEDQIVPMPQGSELAHGAPPEQKRFLENAGHVPHIEVPEAFQAALLEVLDNFD